MKGAERLQRGFTPPALPKPSYNLDVEVKRDGSVKVVSPTNAPPAKP
jgi:hypothetical protein